MDTHLKFFIGMLTILIVFGVGYGYLRSKDVDKNIVETMTATSSIMARGYTIEYAREFPKGEPEETTFWSKISILKDGQTLFSTEETELFSGFYVSEIADWIKDADDLRNRAMADITENGIPEIILQGYSGGSHCCHRIHIIELDEPLKFLLDLKSNDFGITFEDINKDGLMEIKTYESIFSYWNTSFAASPMPPVVLGFQDGKYKADAMLMRRPAPKDLELQRMAKAVENWSGSAGPEVAWKYAIDLIYSGNIASAKKYVDLAWRENEPGDFGTKDNFWRQLKEQIHQSPYYSDLSSYFGL